MVKETRAGAWLNYGEGGKSIFFSKIGALMYLLYRGVLYLHSNEMAPKMPLQENFRKINIIGAFLQ